MIRKESFSSFYDANSNCLHLPRNRFKIMKKCQTKKSAYPVAVLAGQFMEDFKTYTSQGKLLEKKTNFIRPYFMSKLTVIY